MDTVWHYASPPGIKPSLHLIAIPALSDNYIWLLHDDQGRAVVVDPGTHVPVEATLRALHLDLKAVLLTHHHADHIGGATWLRDRYAAPVYAPVDERIEATTQHVSDGDELDLAVSGAQFQVLALPGHTLSHVAYTGAGVLLCGDTLFSLGCGRLFEGTAAQMLASLDRLSTLPGDTQLCCAHEYTAANARFASLVEPDNVALIARRRQLATLSAAGQPSLPCPLAGELAANPFLRVDHPALIGWCQRQGVDTRSRVARFAALRKAKDAFI